MFVDYIEIFVRAGKGGDGCVSFRREKFVPKGGPNGGNGGSGGEIILRASENLQTLQDVGSRKHFKAKNGENGMGSDKHGRNGPNIVIEVPVGTLVHDDEKEQLIADLTEHGAEVVVARGGKGGRGNTSFKTATNQAPRKATPGGAGEEKKLSLELKVLADVGLVGFPNAGKSTLLSVVSAAKPKIAGYPFTTLVPQLGIVKTGDYNSFVIADIPGLIEGAHMGKGLGHQFLKHIERTQVLVFLIDVQSEDIQRDYAKLLDELERFNPSLLKRKRLVVISKIDTVPIDKRVQLDGVGKVFYISAVSGQGLDALKQELWNNLYSENPN